MTQSIEAMVSAKGRILVVDDDRHMLVSTRDLLALHGFEVLTAASGAEALATLRHQDLDVMLLDLHMEGINGLQVMEFLSKHRMNVLVIVVSGDASVEAAIHSLRYGAYDYLRKPYAPEALVRAVDNAVGKRVLERENQVIRDKLERSERLYRFMVNSSPDVVYMLDESGHFTFVNDRVETILGIKKEDLIGKHYSRLVFDEDVELARFALNERRTGKRATFNLELRLRRGRREAPRGVSEAMTVSVELTSMGVYAQDNGKRTFVGSYGVLRDLTERKRAERTIKYQAYHDLLTGLPNRFLFKDHVELALAHARRSDSKVAVIFLDLDRFKLINDTLGHAMGDALLRAVGRRLKACLRAEDTLARNGGDEFVVLLARIGSRFEAEQVAHKIISELNTPFLIETYEFFVSASLGVAFFPDDGEALETLIRHADVAMYNAKNVNRGRYCMYSAEMDEMLSRNLTFEREMHRGLESNQFTAHYQPQISSETGAIVGLEALVRWEHPQRGLLTPGEFIPIAEEVGLIGRIGELLLRTACADLKRWYEMGLPHVRLSVNLSALQLVKHDFVDDILEVLKDNGLSGECLELEITEHVVLTDVESVIQKLRRLSSHGITVAIDDFGTGYSSLSYLQRLPVHTLKIDRSFLQEVAEGRKGSSIVAGIISMAKGLNLNIVAEGVETEYQRLYLESLGCPEMQGFLFSRPIDEAGARELLLANPFVHAPRDIQ
jgi:diguanylate cyclase (GGDEF)-like protein/PAS domain S-box-containing protein